jgi:hypothetical protein
MKSTLTWVATFLIHAIAQFAAWAMADAAARPSTLLGRLLMFPAFTLAGRAADRWFWLVFLINSAIWASVITFILVQWSMRIRDDE